MSELRALEVFSTIPAGCILQCVTNNDSDPHLRAGEFAVIDTTDTEPQNGEVYLIQWLTGGVDIVQAFTRPYRHPERGEQIGWWTRCLQHISFDKAVAKARKLGGMIEVPAACNVDGPRQRGSFQQALVGRVIGIYQASEPVLTPMKQIGGRGNDPVPRG